MIKQTELLALAYKRYIQTKESRLNAENTFKQAYPEECYETYKKYFEELCSKIDNLEHSVLIVIFHQNSVTHLVVGRQNVSGKVMLINLNLKIYTMQ